MNTGRPRRCFWCLLTYFMTTRKGIIRNGIIHIGRPRALDGQPAVGRRSHHLQNIGTRQCHTRHWRVSSQFSRRPRTPWPLEGQLALDGAAGERLAPPDVTLRLDARQLFEKVAEGTARRPRHGRRVAGDGLLRAWRRADDGRAVTPVGSNGEASS